MPIGPDEGRAGKKEVWRNGGISNLTILRSGAGDFPVDTDTECVLLQPWFHLEGGSPCVRERSVGWVYS